MRTGIRRGLWAAVLTACLVGVPATAQADAPAWVPCGDSAALVAAVEQANDDGGGTIRLAPGCEYPLSAAAATDHGPDGLPVITGRVWISGYRSTIARAAGAPFFRIIEVAPVGDLTLTGVTITRGVAPRGAPMSELGGGILNRGGELSLIGSRVVGNTAHDGGGIFHDGGRAELLGSEVTGNNAVAGGAGIYQVAGELSALRSAVDGNIAGGDGGGLNLYGGFALLRETSAVGNIAGGRGGGVRVGGGWVSLVDSRVAGNTNASNCFPRGVVAGCPD